MLTEHRRELIDHMQRHGKYEDLTKLKVLQEAIEAASRAHAAERDSHDTRKTYDMARKTSPISDPRLSIGFSFTH